jgi:hypothetical protein
MGRYWFPVVLHVVLISQSVSADLVTHFSFNSYDGNSAVINADSGGGVISLSSPAGGAAWPAIDLATAAGTSLNLVAPDAAGNSLALSDDDNNGGALTVAFSALGFTDLSLSLAMLRHNQGYDSVQLSYSINGTDFTDFGAAVDPGVSFAVQSFDLGSVDAIENQSTAYFRLTFNGAGNNPGYVHIDNLQINGMVAAPEPQTWAMMIVMAGFFSCAFRRRHRQQPAAVNCDFAAV